MSHLESKSPKALASQGEKDADPGIAELEDAKNRLAGLKSEHANHKYHESSRCT